MSKMEVTFWVVFSLCCFAVLVLGSTESDESKTTTENPLENLEGLFSYFKTLENRIRVLEKSQEECKSLKISNENSKEELTEQIKSLRNEVDEMKNGTRRDDGVQFLTPRLRGPPGKQGEAGQTGEVGQVGPEGASGKPGEAGVKGEKGDSGLVGPKGEKGTTGLQGTKGDRGISAVDPRLISCSDAMEILPSPRSTKQSIYPHANNKSLEVLCDFDVDEGGWTVIQKRSSGPLDDFNKTWDEYSTGFGSLDGNFWLGLENIRALTKNGGQELRIELEDFQGRKAYAKYSSFSISDASDFYRLAISGFYGNSTAGDMMTNSVYSFHFNLNGMRFSTKDNDNDLHSGGSCLEDRGGGGWWFNHCGWSNLNGLYKQKGESWGITWYSWKNSVESLAKTQMKIRKRK